MPTLDAVNVILWNSLEEFVFRNEVENLVAHIPLHNNFILILIVFGDASACREFVGEFLGSCFESGALAGDSDHRVDPCLLYSKDFETIDTGHVLPFRSLDTLDQYLTLHLLFFCPLLFRFMLLRRLLLFLRQFDSGKQLFKEIIVMCSKPFLTFGYSRLELAVFRGE